MRTITASGIAEMAYQYHDYLISYAQRYAQSYEDARDIVQDAYLALMERAPEEVDTERFGAYLRNLVYWRYKDYYRGCARTDGGTEGMADDAPLTRAEDTEFARAVRDEAIKAVPEAYRPTILLWLDGMNFLQISTRLSVTAGNARQRVQKYMPLFRASARRLATARV